MGQIIKKHTFERSEDFGGGQVTQEAEYNSVSETITAKTDKGDITLPVEEWTMLIKLMTEAVSVKG